MSRRTLQQALARVVKTASVLAVAGNLMTPGLALAEHANPAAPTTSPAAEPESSPKPQGTPIQLRPNGPQEAGSSTTTNMGLKLLAVAAVLGGAALFLRRRKNTLMTAGATPGRSFSPKVLGRTSIGMRSELLVVEIDGQKIVLGVTPSSVSTLTILTEEPKDAPAEPELLSAREAAIVRPFANYRDPISEDPPAHLPVSMAPKSTAVEESLTRLLAGARATPHNDESVPAPAPTGRARATRARNIEASSFSLEGQVRGLGARKRG